MDPSPSNYIYMTKMIALQKSNIDTKNGHVLKGPVTSSKMNHHFGGIQPLVFREGR